MEISIDVRELDWHSAKLRQPPKDQPVVAIAPAGNVSIFLGRELLDWTGWLTLDEFNAQVKELVESHAVTMGDTITNRDGSTGGTGDTVIHYDGSSE